jgi:hypothetical protein
MAGVRYSIFPADALDDPRVTDLHLRLLGLLGTYSDNNGWLIVNQATLAARAKRARETINRAIRDLVEWGYLRKRGRVGEDGRRLVNHYQVVMDREPAEKHAAKDLVPAENKVAKGRKATDHVTPTSHGPCDAHVTGYVTSRDHRVCDLQTSQLNDPFLERPLSPKGERRAGARKPSLRSNKSTEEGKSGNPLIDELMRRVEAAP